MVVQDLCHQDSLAAFMLVYIRFLKWFRYPFLAVSGSINQTLRGFETRKLKRWVCGRGPFEFYIG